MWYMQKIDTCDSFYSDLLNLYVCVRCRCDKVEEVSLSDHHRREKDGRLAHSILQDLKGYLEGDDPDFSKYEVDSSFYTDFEWRVLEEARKIPFGKEIFYSDLAGRVFGNKGNMRGARAVGNALSKNRTPLITPCHRVIGKNNIGGYKYGVEIKKKLLNLEREANG